jgi:hypothetical protein
VLRGSWGADDGHRLVLDAVEGVVSARRLVELGVPERTVYARCRPGGPWQLLLPATVLLSNGEPTRDQLVTAGLLYAGEDAVVTGLEACRRLGVRRGPSTGRQVHLLVPHYRQPRSTGYVAIERTRRMPRPVRRGRFPLAPNARAAVDAARRLRSQAEVTELLADVVQRRLCTVRELAAEVDACQRRGTAVPRRILRDVNAGARSVAERDAQRLWRRSGLPEPLWNASVYDASGQLLGIADGWWDDVGLAWEINSFAGHLLPEDYAREQEKAARFAAAGITVVPTHPTRMPDDADAVIDELRQAFEHAAGRTRPPVRATRSPG